MSALAPITEIIADIKAGKMVILVDEEDRENEGDLVMAAEFVTPDAINFMAKHGRGLICLTLTDERCRQLGNVPNELMAEYYRQRATAGLIITEGTSPSADGLGYARIPGLFNQEHVVNWRRITQTVHHHGGHIFVQLMHT